MPIPSRPLRCEPLEDRTAPAAGDLDPTFGTGGKVALPLIGVEDVAILSDGKILLAGAAEGDFAAARLNPDGTIDSSFGTGGRTTVPFGLGQLGFDQAATLAVQPDGKIVLAGSVNTGDIEGALGVVRLTADGQLDPTFGTGGKLTISFDPGVGPDARSAAADVAVQPDGKIVLAGRASHVVLGPTGGTGFQSFAVARLNPDGSLDPTFDGDGKLTLSFGDRDQYPTGATAVLLQPGGKIVLTGAAGGVNYDVDFVAVRLHPDGSLDPTFGDGGLVVVPVSPPGPAGVSWDEPRDAALLPDGSFLLAGGAGPSLGDFAVVRLTPDGAPDPAFGTGGVVRVAFDLVDCHSLIGG